MLDKGRSKGITLISLVITIIILLILAGIVISLTIGENGIINRAKEAGDKYGQAQKNELTDLSNLEEQLGKYITGGIPENKEDTDAGTIVQLPDTWAMQTMRQVSTNDGKDIVDSTKIATVYAVATGNGEQVPVPYGFWYVGGNLNTGVIISDNEADSFLKNGKDMSSYADSLNLQGNQFVWIPCTLEDYKKTDWGKQNSNWDTTTPEAETTQIQKYGGFYVARYEAGLATTIPEFTVAQENNGINHQIYNKSGVPQSKSGQIPWNFIDWTNSKANAKSMYHNNYVNSGLITGTQWDVILNTLVNKSVLAPSDVTDSSSWGNYINDSLTFTGDYSVYVLSSKYQYPFGDTSVTGDNLYKTGMSETAMKYGISDIAGNVWEWTEEASMYGGNVSTQYRMSRGAGFITTSYPSACYRNGDIVNSIFSQYGFRVVLYMK